MGFDSDLKCTYNEPGYPLEKLTQQFYLSSEQHSNRMSDPDQKSDFTDLPQPPKDHVSRKQPQIQLTMSPDNPSPLRITEQEFISDHISHSTLKLKSLALEEAEDILKLLVGMKMFKDLGDRKYDACDMEDLCKISQRVECLRTALTDFDEFMARRYQGVKEKGEWEGRDRFMDKAEGGSESEG
jgi:hypothetical protein